MDEEQERLEQERLEQERQAEIMRRRRARREAARRKHERRRRIFFGSIFLIILLIIIIIFKACSSGKDEEETVNTETQDAAETEIEEVEEPALSIVTPEVTVDSVTLAFVGDIMCYDNQITAAATDTGYDFSGGLTNVTEYLSSADLTIGNLELNFYGEENTYSGYPSFNAPEALADNLADAGFDILQTANTYSIQNGLNGLTSTLTFIRAAGMEAIGTYSSESDAEQNGVLIEEVNGIRIAFIAFTKGVNNNTLPTGYEYAVDLLYTDYDTNYQTVDEDAILEKIEAAQDQEPDVIIALLHWGSEYELGTSTTQAEIQDLMFENGVDVIVGTHSHVVDDMERQTITTSDGVEKEVFTALSLGNFLSSMTTEDTQASVILNIEITKDSNGVVELGEISYIPLYIQNDSGDLELIDIHAALEDETLDSDLAATLEDALETLHENAGEEFDIVNVSSDEDTDTASADTAAAGGTETTETSESETGTDSESADSEDSGTTEQAA